MKVGIVGVGMVGGACKYGFEKLGHDVRVYDPKIEGSKFEDILDTKIVYICVPTNAKEDGSCDTSIVEATIKDLGDSEYRGIVAIKSTVEPGFTQRMINNLSPRVPKLICFVPEFLRERCAITDFTENHDLLAVGTHNRYAYDLVVKCHGKYPKEVVCLTPTEAEVLKYYSNVFNALRIIFANEMYELCKALGADYTSIKEAFMLRKTATDMYMDVNENFRGYCGYCLPKDVKAIVYLVKKLNLDLELFSTIDKENDKFEPTAFEGMRK